MVPPSMKPPAVVMIVVAALSGLSGSARAEDIGNDRPFYYGVKVGVNATTLFGNGADDSSVHLSLGLGAFYAHELFDKFRLAPEFLMTEKGADFEDLSGNDADQGFLYLQLPILARYDLPLSEMVSFYGFGGPAAAYVIDSKRMPKTDLSRFDISTIAGLGVDINPGSHRILVDVRGEIGLLNQLDRPDGRSARNLGISLFAGVSM